MIVGTFRADLEEAAFLARSAVPEATDLACVRVCGAQPAFNA